MNRESYVFAQCLNDCNYSRDDWQDNQWRSFSLGPVAEVLVAEAGDPVAAVGLAVDGQTVTVVTTETVSCQKRKANTCV